MPQMWIYGSFGLRKATNKDQTRLNFRVPKRGETPTNTKSLSIRRILYIDKDNWSRDGRNYSQGDEGGGGPSGFTVRGIPLSLTSVYYAGRTGQWAFVSCISPVWVLVGQTVLFDRASFSVLLFQVMVTTSCVTRKTKLLIVDHLLLSVSPSPPLVS